MAVFECTSRVTRRSLMNKTKDELATRVLELMEEIGTVRDRLEKVEADRRDEGLRRIGQTGYEAAAAERYEELRAAAKAALGEIPCGPEWLERLRSAVACAQVKDTVSAARGRMDGLAERTFERVCRERAEAVARAEAAEGSLQAVRAWIGERTLTAYSARGNGESWLYSTDCEQRVEVTALLPLLAAKRAETQAADAAMLAGFLDKVLAEPWAEAALVELIPVEPSDTPHPPGMEFDADGQPVAYHLAPFEAEMAEALAPLFAPAPSRDSDLPAVVSPCA